MNRLEKALNDAHYEVFVAPDGEKAIRYVEHPDKSKAVLDLLRSKGAVDAMWAASCSLTGVPRGKHPECALDALVRWLGEDA